ncbi:hypothetical protein FQY83_15135 [Luteimonas marina]|uniref:Uncharacterized protein n=1 Tax=Luteimonas marina TaxID=488485 RepID=A0A5C5TZJ1_9GAMM|nr:hypothetical protein [Luteimonas marina]TWT18702.1 hypothetical protein FQY83_15135 [Luteimonas marina]
MAPRLLLCLLLACAALPVVARQPAMMDANGGSAACPVTAETEVEAEAEPVRPGDKRATAPNRTRPAAARRGSEAESSARPPRWHSFLPGMIR